MYCIEWGPEARIRYIICKTVIFQAYNLRKTLKTTDKTITIIVTWSRSVSQIFARAITAFWMIIIK